MSRNCWYPGARGTPAQAAANVSCAAASPAPGAQPEPPNVSKSQAAPKHAIAVTRDCCQPSCKGTAPHKAASHLTQSTAKAADALDSATLVILHSQPRLSGLVSEAALSRLWQALQVLLLLELQAWHSAKYGLGCISTHLASDRAEQAKP